MAQPIAYDQETMLNAQQNILECEQALHKIKAYAREYCSLEGSFGLLLQPLQPIHNGARDAVMDNLDALGGALTQTALSVNKSYLQAKELEERIRHYCDCLIAEIHGEEHPEYNGGSTPGGGTPGGGSPGGGSPGGGSSGGGTPPPPAPVTPPPPPVGPETSRPETAAERDERLGKRFENCPYPGCHNSRCRGECVALGETEDPGPNWRPGSEKSEHAEVHGGPETPGQQGHPVGCRCTACDVHPAGCRCQLCEGANVQLGCSPSCAECRSGKTHLPPWYVANCDFGKPHLENFVKLPAEFNGSEDARLEDARERARYEEARIEAEREQARLQERRMEEYRHLKEQELAAEGRRFVEREQIQILRAHNTPNDVWGGDYRTPVCGVTPGFSIDALITQAYSVPRVERSAR